MVETDIIFSNAAIQNRSYDLDTSPGKMVGIMVAQFLNRVFDNPEVVHVWNNVGMFDEVERNDPCVRLENKYKSSVMQRHLDYWGIDGQLEILTDEDDNFSDWTLAFLQRCLDKGDIYIQGANFHVCDHCDLVIAESVVDVERCGRCEGTALYDAFEPALFVDMPEDRSTLLPQRSVFNAINIRQEQAALSQIPPRLLLSRARTRGIELKDFGLADKKLDPRLGIGLLALYIAEINDYAKGCLVQSTSTLMRTVPYIKSVVVDADRLHVPEPFFAAHMKIDTHLLTDVNLPAIEQQVLLPLASLRRKQDVRPNDLTGIRTELSKTKARVESNIEVLGRLGLLGDQNACMPEDINRVIIKGKLNDLLPTLNKTLGKSIYDMKRLTTTDVTESVRENARGTITTINFYQKIFGEKAE